MDSIVLRNLVKHRLIVYTLMECQLRTVALVDIYGHTRAGGATQDGTREEECPCNTGNTNAQVPPFVGNDYYCESASNVVRNSNTLYPDDPLWDGQQCTNLEGPCCTHPNMPWFAKMLNEITTENIELRSCFNRDEYEDTPLQIVELYVR